MTQTPRVGIMAAALLFLCAAAPSPVLRGPGPTTHSEAVLAHQYVVSQLMERAASVARARATRDDVRAWADRLRRDHDFAARKNLNLASDLGMNLAAAAAYLRERAALPEAPEYGPYLEQALAVRELEAELEALSKLEGLAYDARFVSVVHRSHALQARRLSEAVADIPMPRLERSLARELRIIEQHVALGELLTHELGGPSWPVP